MTTQPTTGSASGWDQAIYRCGRCGAKYTVTTEEAYLQAVGVHTDAHAVWDRLNPIERDGLTSILRTILSAPELGIEFLALADRQHHTGGDTQSPRPCSPRTPHSPTLRRRTRRPEPPSRRTTMPTTAITAEDIISRYAADIAYVAEKDKDQATDIGAFADQLGTAARNFSLARIDGHEDVQTAAAFLHEAHLSTDATERTVFLRKADKLLSPIVWEMKEEFREMVGD